jgi:phage-related baseplate assembly protein
VATSPFAYLPSISFANIDQTALSNAIVAGFQAAWLQETGETVVLSQSDRRYNFLMSLTAYFTSAYEQINAAAQQNLLPFASGGFLENLAAFYGPRAAPLPASGATVTLQFTLATTLSSVATIPAGTQVASAASNATGIVFATNTSLSIPIGQLTGTVAATCTTTGVIGNGLPINTVTTLLNWSSPFVVTVTNIEPTAGGANAEDQSAGGAYAQRIFLVTDSYSNAGSYGAYEFFALSADPSISSVSVSGPEDGLAPGNVLVTVLCQNGTFPNSAILAEVLAAVNPNTVRDLCANVTVAAPSGYPFALNVSYYVPTALANNAANIQTSVSAAVQTFITNITTVLAADIDPSVLTEQIVLAGGIRVTVTTPTFVSLAKSQVAVLSGSPSVNYLGLS